MGSKDPLNPLIEVLAAFAAARNYSYVDRVGNSLEPLAALEALKDALRDFDSTCSREKYIKKDEASNLCVPCPRVSSKDLYDAINSIEDIVADMIAEKCDKSKKGRRRFLEETRRLATNALSRAGNYRRKCREEG